MNTPASTGAAGYQVQFVRALLSCDDPEPSPGQAAWATHPAFAVYRNTVMKGCIDALQANFPAVTRLVGEDWFRAAAAVYVRAHPPGDPRLFRYGLQQDASKPSFACFLADFAPAQALPYLPGVARLDAAWATCHTAADAPVADAAVLTALAPQALGALCLRPHPAACWAWHDDLPLYTLWSASRAGSAVDEELVWQGEGALLCRPHDSVQWCPLGHAGCVLLDACASGAPLGQAAEAALQAEPACALADLLALLLQQGAFQQPAGAPSTS